MIKHIIYIRRCCESFRTSETCLLIWCSGSAIVCDDFIHKLMRIGKPSNYCPDIHLQKTFIPAMTQEDLAIFVSYCGKTKGIVTAAK